MITIQSITYLGSAFTGPAERCPLEMPGGSTSAGSRPRSLLLKRGAVRDWMVSSPLGVAPMITRPLPSTLGTTESSGGGAAERTLGVPPQL